ncbi:MAG: hypothetical protein LBO07_03045 [Coriobacteriales bacterium]|nr:hypothetical protein [Coriobacteriales bacterium]
MAAKPDERRLEVAKTEIEELVRQSSRDASDPKTARALAKEALGHYLDHANADLKQAAERFRFLQKVEYIIGAVVIVQVVVLLLILKGESAPLALTSALSVVLYVIAAVIDSRAKGKRQDFHFRVLAAKKAKFRNVGTGIVVEFD